MPLKLVVRRRAERDILQIVRYVARTKQSPEEAQRLGNRLIDSCERILTAPRMGAPSSVGRDARKVNEGPYQIIYRVTEHHVIILRIWDGRRGSDLLL